MDDVGWIINQRWAMSSKNSNFDFSSLVSTYAEWAGKFNNTNRNNI